MGYLVFVLIVVSLLLGYYIWIIASGSRTSQGGDYFNSELNADEMITYHFDAPIQVSKEFISPVVNPYPTERSLEDLEKEESSSSNQNLLDLMSIERARKFTEEVFGFFLGASPSDTNTTSAEVEYLSFLNLQKAVADGHEKFSHINFA